MIMMYHDPIFFVTEFHCCFERNGSTVLLMRGSRLNGAIDVIHKHDMLMAILTPLPKHQ